MRIGLLFACLTVVACSGDGGGDDDVGDDDDDNVGDDDDGGGNGTRDFGQDFEDKYCDEYEDCSGTSDCPLTTLPTNPGGTTPNTTTAECDFDQQAADDCLNADWECMSVEGFSFILIDPACCAVCGGEPCPTTSF